MTVNIAETITLNGVNRGSSTTFSIPSIKYVENGIVTLTSAVSKIFVFDATVADDKSILSAGVKYIRLTNLDTSYDAKVSFVQGSDTAWFLIPAYKSMTISDVGLDADSSPIASSPTLANLDSISGQGTGTMALEYFIAST
jgi:hypothetical protein